MMNSGKKIGILFITLRADFGGGPEHLYRLLSGLSPRFRAYVAAPEDYPYYERYCETVGKENVIVLPHRKFTLGYLFKLVRFVKDNEINIIHSMGKGAGIYGRPAAFLASCFSVHTFHGIHIGSYNFIQKKIYLLLERCLGVFTTKAISVSENEKNVVESHKMFPLRKLEIINNGVVIGEKPAEKVIENSDTIDIVTITRFDYQKNSTLLIPIIERLKQLTDKKINLILLGTGEQEKEVKELAEKKGVAESFHFRGSVTNPLEHMRNAHLCLSTSRWEGLPIALLEAMSAGLPVIASDVVGNKDIVKDGYNGYLYDVKSPDEAAEAIMKAVNSNDKWNELSSNAYETIRNKFGIEEMVNKTENVYLKIMGEEV